MTNEDLEILTHMQQGTKPPEFAIRLLEDVCKRTGLDWKARHVYLQKRRGKTGDTWQAVLSIDGFRAVGARHPDYAGQEGPFFVTSSDAAWTDIPPDAKPYAAKVGIRKRDGLTTWGVGKYGDYYAGMMWDKFPSTMIAKCAEMLAWRKTFPETFGGLYGDAEMDQSTKKGKEMEVAQSDKPNTDTPEKDPTIRVGYLVRLSEAKSGDEVKAIGREIQADKALDQAEVIELHKVYTTKMKAYK